jgi:hypothetical protein
MLINGGGWVVTGVVVVLLEYYMVLLVHVIVYEMLVIDCGNNIVCFNVVCRDVGFCGMISIV